MTEYDAIMLKTQSPRKGNIGRKGWADIHGGVCGRLSRMWDAADLLVAFVSRALEA